MSPKLNPPPTRAHNATCECQAVPRSAIRVAGAEREQGELDQRSAGQGSGVRGQGSSVASAGAILNGSDELDKLS